MSGHASLDETCAAAARALRARGVAAPAALFLLGTGVNLLPARLARSGKVAFESIDGVPRRWRESALHFGEFNGLSVWMIEDATPSRDELDPAWTDAFPVWLAAQAGASALVLSSAGVALAREQGEPLATRSFALLSDHVNLSGSTPLAGLAHSQLGPMFPDQTRVHDRALRRAALATARRLGIAASEAVAACTLGPTLDTPAERRFFARAGADVAVQGLAAPLIAAAHAGLGTLAIVAVTAGADEEIDVGRIAAQSHALAPALDDWLWELAAAAQREVRARLDEDLA